MKVLAINGSPKAKGNTYHAIEMLGAELLKEGIELEIVHVGNQAIRGCTSCGMCAVNKNEKCIIETDIVNEIIQKAKDVDGIIISSPVYYSGIAGTMKSFLDRMFYVMGVNGSMLRHKVATAVVADRRSGGVSTFMQLNHYLTYSEMILATSNYWNVAFGRAPGEVVKDEEGTQIMRVLGKNMAWLLKLKEFGKEQVPAPERENKVFMHFIR